MAVASNQVQGKWRGLVVVADLGIYPARPKFVTLFSSELCRTRAEAQAIAFREMWPLYQLRYGFKHPEDPTRCSFDVGVPEGWELVVGKAA
jgi:hypothetical protein